MIFECHKVWIIYNFLLVTPHFSSQNLKYCIIVLELNHILEFALDQTFTLKEDSHSSHQINSSIRFGFLDKYFKLFFRSTWLHFRDNSYYLLFPKLNNRDFYISSQSNLHQISYYSCSKLSYNVNKLWSLASLYQP